jgi:hypothetical protein
MRKIALFVILLISNFINAQHCPYDGSSVVVLKVHTRENQNSIPNLHVTLIKKKNGKVKKSPIIILYQMVRFPFITDEYWVQIPKDFKMDNLYLKIESVYQFDAGGYFHYGTTEIKVSESDKYDLCDLYDSYQNAGIIEKRIYHPVEIVLQKKQESSDN